MADMKCMNEGCNNKAVVVFCTPCVQLSIKRLKDAGEIIAQEEWVETKT